ncbi:molybdate transport system substrate-binding protein [Anaerocolumna jejuensis DSM 15929]|uniref:Molybdate transport system substrate-binding protein n=2 Tax=Anaerocolumna TaxID=1843210 RepID=A0A1M6K8F8_9FIRM|nr:molybdate ABC transporter substrate-binding protein [Anaerocolumna jejuensis]SHJ55219.1 molybdate transport system substrate-binding protein [Anaerocolumna jejuensis DSM 15929]
MRKMKKPLLLTLIMLVMLAAGCQVKEKNSDQASAVTPEATAAATTEATETDTPTPEPTKEVQKTEILIAAAASLQNALEEIKPLYEGANPGVTLTFTFGASGSLQEQIEQGAPVDVFMSAALKQMSKLEGEGLILDGSKKELLENKVVLIVPNDSKLAITSFEDITKAKMIGLGDPASVPVGQYAEEVFTSLGNLEEVKKKATYGKDVTEVLTWVATGNVDAGVVYATDAKSSKDVKVVAEAPEGSVSKAIYPAAVVKASKIPDAAKAFVDYLATDEAMKIFENYGFIANK